jgi:hypothetical protein
MSIVLECGALPKSVCSDDTPGTPGGEPTLVIELTR